MQENFKPVKGYEGLYEISNKGTIKSIRRYLETKDDRKYLWGGKLLKPVINCRFGYKQIRLRKNNKYKTIYIHKLVALTYLTPIQGKNEVNHKDGNKLNNCVENLEWCNRQENVVHSIKNGLKDNSIKPETREKINRTNKLKRAKKVYQYDLKMNLINIHETTRIAAKDVNGHQGNISLHCRNLKPYKGFIFTYIQSLQQPKEITEIEFEVEQLPNFERSMGSIQENYKYQLKIIKSKENPNGLLTIKNVKYE